MNRSMDTTTWNDSFISALRSFRLGDLDTAERRLDKAFADGGNGIPHLHLLAGHIALLRGAAAEAEKSWRRVHEIDPENAEAWNNLGVLYRRRGDDDKALAAFQEAQEKAPDRPDIPYNIGNLHKSGGRYEEAVAAYNRAIEVDPDYAPAYNNLGTLYESRKQRNKALEVFKRGLSIDSGDASIRYNMGLVFQDEKRWDDARDAFDTALRSRPGWTPGLNNLGIVLQEMGREDEAARTFRSLLDIEPDNVSALNNLGVAYDRLGRTDDARRCFRRALEEEPGYVKAALNLHDSYHDGHELNEALEEINKQITHHPRNPDIRVRMGRTLMGLTRWDEAAQSLDHVLERDPDNRDALRAKAELFLATRRPEEAEAILKRLPHDPDVVRDLARLYIATDRPDSAERLLKELAAVNPDDAESRRLLADVMAESRPDEALRLREEAAAAAPGNTGDLLSLAELYGRTGDKDRALEKLDDAVNLLGARGEADDLDEMDAVLGLYENAAEALEDEHGELFSERTAQLGRKLQSAMGHSGVRTGRGRILAGEMPLEEDDALSLLDINAMEPIIRINEEEETVYLDESAEDLEDAFTELERREERDRMAGGGGGRGSADSPEHIPGGPPVHIHIPPQSFQNPPPQVIYQDIRPVSHPPAPPAPSASPAPSPPPAPVVEEIAEEELPELDVDEDDGMLLELEEGPSLEIVETEEVFDDGEAEADIGEDDIGEDDKEADDLFMDEDEEDDGGFFVPDSDALSEDLPDTEEPEIPEAGLVFADEDTPEVEPPALEEAEDALFLDEDYESIAEPEEVESEYEESEETVPEDGFDLTEELLTGEYPPEPEEEVEDLIAASEPEDGHREDTGQTGEESPGAAPGESGAADGVDTARMADMFRYLSELTDKTTGEGRQQLIEDGVPLKLAGLHARLSGEPKFRDVAQKYDRRRRERHNVELDEDKIRGSLDAFRSLAEAYPGETVSESLSQKLGRIMSFVGKMKKTGPTPESDGGTADDSPPPAQESD